MFRAWSTRRRASRGASGSKNEIPGAHPPPWAECPEQGDVALEVCSAGNPTLLDFSLARQMQPRKV
eukprot:8136556-Alexandrium_andersonii.AAC.1